MVEESIIASVKKYLRALKDKGLNVSFGVLYGSYATGHAGPDSDIDVVVVSSEFDNRERNDELVFTLWRVAGRTDSRVEPFPCGVDQWKNDDGSHIVEIARRTGTVVSVAD